MTFKFKIQKKLEEGNGEAGLARAGEYTTPHGVICTPAFVAVGTKAAMKGMTPDMLKATGAQVFLANTYHLYIAPGDEIIQKAGGLNKFTNWSGPTMTDSGGFQAFSLGAAFGQSVSKIATEASEFVQTEKNQNKKARAKITEEGVEFRSYKNGSKHFFTPEKSIQIQHNLGADIIVAFDECTSPQASYSYQREAMLRTHRWAERSLAEHEKLEEAKLGGDTSQYPQALFGVVQGGRHLDLRAESAQTLGAMNFEGFGIGGSFDKHDMDTAVRTACENLPEEKPRHLLGIGEVVDLFLGVENGIDLFDCVAPTRMARHGGVHTKDGKINLLRAPFKEDFTPIDEGCECYACKSYSKAYIGHLLREGEYLGATLASIHNVYFVAQLVESIRNSVLDDTFHEFKKNYLAQYYKK